MAIDFQNLKFSLNKTRPVGYKYPVGLSFGLKGFFNAATETISDSTNFVTAVNETSPSGPDGGTANTSMQWNTSGTFIPKFTGEVEVLVVAGGGGAAHGGGGAGGLTYVSNQPVTNGTTYNCLVGAGGIHNTTAQASPTAPVYGPPGYRIGPNAWERGGYSSNIAEMPIVTTGGGGGAQPASTYGDNSTYSNNNGGPGGSGGGGGRGEWRPAAVLVYTQTNGTGGAGTVSQGNGGGDSNIPAGIPQPPPSPASNWPYGSAGGGGGAGQAGETGRLDHLGAYGGDGLEYSISGTPTYYAGGGGGGGGWMNNPAGALDMMTHTAGPGGTGGGGDGAFGAWNGSPGGTPAYPFGGVPVTPVPGVAGTANRGGGGGGGMPGQSIPANGANGGSGVIIIRFKTFQRLDSNFFID